MTASSSSPWRSQRGAIQVNGFIFVAAILLAIVIIFSLVFTYTTVQGDEVAVKETWDDGVVNQFFPAKTYVHNRWTSTYIPYKTSGHVFVMNDKSDKQEPFAEGRRVDPLEVNSLDNQKVRFHIIVTWRIDPAHVVELHKSYRSNIEERLIRPEVVRAVGTRATIQSAIDLYSGAKLNTLRSEVEIEFKDPKGKLAQSGILVDSFVIEKPEFPNDLYVKAIESRQLAMISESAAKEQKKANDALAEAEKSKAQITANTRIVAQEADKEMAILKQEAESGQSTIKAKAEALNAITTQEAESKKIVLQAEADAKKQIALSEASKQAEINRAIGIEAVGKAEAEAQKLKLAAFAVSGSDNYTRIEVARQLGLAFSSVKGYLPSNMNFSLVGDDFQKTVAVLSGPNTPTPSK